MEKYFVTGVLDDCTSPQDTFDLLGGLFDAMNTKGGTAGGRFKGVAYFNGGLFAQPARVELVADESAPLKEACQFNWSTVRPEIFGTIFEHSLGKEARHATGAHYTSPVDTIVRLPAPTPGPDEPKAGDDANSRAHRPVPGPARMVPVW